MVQTSHEISKMTESLAENHIPMFGRTLFEFLLQIPATVLVLAQGGNFSLQVLQAGTCKSVNYCVMSAKGTERRGRGFTFTIHIPTFVLRAVQAIHLAIGSTGTPTETQAIPRTIVVQSCRPTVVGIVISATIRIEAIRVVRRAIESIVQIVGGVILLLRYH